MWRRSGSGPQCAEGVQLHPLMADLSVLLRGLHLEEGGAHLLKGAQQIVAL